MRNNVFDAKKVKDDIVAWIRRYFADNGSGCVAVIGISGGKDSSIVAALCVEALGKDRVYGVLMPNGTQSDIHVSWRLVRYLEIDANAINIAPVVSAFYEAMAGAQLSLNQQVTTNTPARIRMAMLYAVSAVVNGRVANTCNLSEDWVGYSTKFGDSAGDFSPLAQLTVAEVKAVGRECGLPDVFIDKVPEDGLSGKTDEDNLGFTYETLDRYIREGVCEDAGTKARIDRLHKANLHKITPMPSYPL